MNIMMMTRAQGNSIIGPVGLGLDLVFLGLGTTNNTTK